MIILKMISITLSKPAKIIEMTLTFMKEELLIICGHLRESLNKYNDKADCPLNEVGQAKKHIEEVEKQIANWILAEEYGRDPTFKARDRIEMKSDAFYKIINELKNAIKQIEKHEIGRKN